MRFSGQGRHALHQDTLWKILEREFFSLIRSCVLLAWTQYYRLLRCQGIPEISTSLQANFLITSLFIINFNNVKSNFWEIGLINEPYFNVWHVYCFPRYIPDTGGEWVWDYQIPRSIPLPVESSKCNIIGSERREVSSTGAGSGNPLHLPPPLSVIVCLCPLRWRKTRCHEGTLYQGLTSPWLYLNWLIK